MKRRVGTWVALTTALLLTTGALADDLTGVDAVLCSSGEVTVCTEDGECDSGPSTIWNVPQFIVLDFKARTLATTAASGENRSTPMKNVERADGTIFVQGLENGRAFSFVIDEETGLMSVAIARDGLTVSVFGACTPEAR